MKQELANQAVALLNNSIMTFMEKKNIKKGSRVVINTCWGTGVKGCSSRVKNFTEAALRVFKDKFGEPG